MLTLAILAILCAAWLWVFAKGISNPNWLLYLWISTICLINLSFFKGEILGRIALPDILLFTLLLVFVIRKVILRDSFSFPLYPSLIFLILLSAISLSLLSESTIKAVIYGEGQPFAIVVGMLFFLLIAEHTQSEDDFFKIMRAWTVAAIIAITVSLIDMSDLSNQAPKIGKGTGFFSIGDIIHPGVFANSFLSPHSFRIQGPFRTPGQLSAFATTTFFALFAFSFAPGQSIKSRLRIWIIAPLLILCAFFTARFSVFPSLATGILVITVYLCKKSPKASALFASIAIVCALVFSLMSYLNPQIFQNSILRNVKKMSSLASGKGFIGNQIDAAKHSFENHPTLGIGYGRFIQSDYQVSIRGYEMHSTLLQFLAETGIVGTLAYLIFMGYFLFLAFQNFWFSRRTAWEEFHAVILFGFICLIPSYLYNRHLRERTFWLFIAVIYLASRLKTFNRERQISS